MPRILFVDDNRELCDLYCYLAGTHGVKAKCIFSGTETIEWLSQPENNVEIVVLDLSMPSLDGLTVAEEIRRNEKIGKTGKVEICFLTGKKTDGAVQRIAERCRIRHIFDKNEDTEAIISEIVSWLDVVEDEK